MSTKDTVTTAMAAMDALDLEIERWEQRVLDAKTIDAARHFHDRLDALRQKRDQIGGQQVRRRGDRQ